MAENVVEQPLPITPAEDAAECTGVNSSVGTTPSVSESVQPAAPSPAAPKFNPFAAPDPNAPKLPPCFDSVAHQLSDQHRAKLKTIDVSTAQVVIQTANGRKSDPQPLSWFVDDFGQEAAEYVGRYGLLRVTVYEPNKQPWFFGIKVASPDGVESSGREDWREAFDELLNMNKRFMENVRMELALGSGGGRQQQPQQVSADDAVEREFSRMQRYMQMFKEANSGNDPGAIIERTMDSMGRVFDGVGKVRDKAAEFAGAQASEPDAVDQIERLTKIPLVEKGIERVFSKALAGRTSEAKAGNPAPPKVDPFADLRNKGVA